MCLPSYFICPVCKKPLQYHDKSHRCVNRHSFDEASSGYVNLLLSSSKHSKEHGDNKEMIRARRDFLDRGYYTALQDKVCAVVKSLCTDLSSPVVVDAGCGEGYYTTAVYQHLKSNCDPIVYGFDMSKEALKIASKRCNQIHFAVANLFSMPLADQTADVLIEMFAPIADKEFHRILKPNGFMVLIVPAPKHLFSLKQAIYDTPYLNEQKDMAFEGFQFTDRIHLSSLIHLSNSQDIKMLFTMTPYFYHTPLEFIKRLDHLNTLDTEIEFDLLIYQKH